MASLPFAALKFLSRAHSEGEQSFRETYASFFNAMLLLATAGTAIACAVAAFGGRFLQPQYMDGGGRVSKKTMLAVDDAARSTEEAYGLTTS